MRCGPERASWFGVVVKCEPEGASWCGEVLLWRGGYGGEVWVGGSELVWCGGEVRAGGG